LARCYSSHHQLPSLSWGNSKGREKFYENRSNETIIIIIIIIIIASATEAHTESHHISQELYILGVSVASYKAGFEDLLHTLDISSTEVTRTAFPCKCILWFQTVYTARKSTFALVDPSANIQEAPLQTCNSIRLRLQKSFSCTDSHVHNAGVTNGGEDNFPAGIGNKLGSFIYISL
jgi:hypothetical protein